MIMPETHTVNASSEPAVSSLHCNDVPALPLDVVQQKRNVLQDEGGSHCNDETHVPRMQQTLRQNTCSCSIDQRSMITESDHAHCQHHHAGTPVMYAIRATSWMAASPMNEPTVAPPRMK